MGEGQRTGRSKARAHVLRTLVEVGTASRADLARRTALAPSTVSAIVGELSDDGLLVEVPPPPDGRGGLGRPPALVALHRRAGMVLGIDFGKRHVRVALADLAHTVIGERRAEVADDQAASDSIG